MPFCSLVDHHCDVESLSRKWILLEYNSFYIWFKHDIIIKYEQLSVWSLINNVMLKYLFWVSYILRLYAQTCTPNRHALYFFYFWVWGLPSNLPVFYVLYIWMACVCPVFGVFCQVYMCVLCLQLLGRCLLTSWRQPRLSWHRGQRLGNFGCKSGW